ncbi:MAG TPA: hypothetical protein VD997_01725 [Phycisphaerales bacterium]|nr:hypothetical protein [Phycisphaerales bacterium]
MARWFGPYRLVRALEPTRVGPRESNPVRSPQALRWSAVHERETSGHLVYTLELAKHRLNARRFTSALEAISVLRHAHVLPIETYALDEQWGGVVVSPYLGDPGGVVTLDELVEAKGGRMDPFEVQRSATHMLEALAAAHSCGLADGNLWLDRVHVDPRGSLHIELLGLWREMWRGGDVAEVVARDDVRSVAAMAFRMLTGVEHGTGPGAPLDRRWEHWLRRGLDPIDGFTTAEEALRELPSGQAVAKSMGASGALRTAAGRVRAALLSL